MPVSLRLRLVLLFALVAGTSTLAMLLATPYVMRYEWEQIEGPLPTATPTSLPSGSSAASGAPSAPATGTAASPGQASATPIPPQSQGPGPTPPPGASPGQGTPASSAHPTASPGGSGRASPTVTPAPSAPASSGGASPGPTRSGSPSPGSSSGGAGPGPSSGSGGGAGSSTGASSTLSAGSSPGAGASPGGAAGSASGSGGRTLVPGGAGSVFGAPIPAIALAARPGRVPHAVPGIQEADASPGTTTPTSPSPGASLPPEIAVRWAEFQRSTSMTLVLVALLAVILASLLGLVLAERVLAPLRRLRDAAAAVSGGDLARRSGIAARRDELGDLGRSFDAMAASLEAADEQRRRFLQDVVHELRTPLTVIDATSSAILDGVYEAEPGHIETIREQAHLLSRIVDDLRTLNLAEIGKLPLDLAVIDAGELLGTTEAAFEAKATATRRRLVLSAASGLAVLADEDRIRQALAALTDNALRHAPEGGEVRLRTLAVDGAVRFEVEDTGPGVAPADLPHVFERFFEADEARDRAAGHTGLGLAIVKALVEAHGGRVGVENAPGAGARFWLELPAAPIEGRGRDGGEVPIGPSAARTVTPPS